MIVISFLAVQRIIKKSRHTIVCNNLNSSAVVKIKLRAEKNNSSMSFAMAFVFVSAWTPYAIISFLVAFAGGQVQVPTLVEYLAVFLAKSSSLSNPVMVACYDKQFKAYLKTMTLRILLVFKQQRTEDNIAVISI